jgi:hypothetical protein
MQAIVQRVGRPSGAPRLPLASPGASSRHPPVVFASQGNGARIMEFAPPPSRLLSSVAD